MNRLVSVIIPTYNYAEFVAKTVESVLSQTFKPIEIIVVNDGSTDDTESVLANYIATNKIKYIYQDNKGLAGARNTGIKKSSGNYLCFLDSDDLIESKKIEVQVISLEEHKEFGVAFSDFRFFKDNDINKLLPAHVKYYGELTFQKIICGEFMPVHSALLRREVIDKAGYFDESLRKCEDYDFWIRVVMSGIRFLYNDQVLAYYRLHSGQMVQDSINLNKTYIEVINRYKTFDSNSAKLALGKYGQLIGKLLIYEDRMKEGRQYLWNYLWYRKHKALRVLTIIFLSYCFSGDTIRRITNRSSIHGVGHHGKME